MNGYKYSTLKDVVDRFRRKRILVIGDLLLDQYVKGKVSRISPEAPVPVVWVEEEDFVPGGACNVASNLAELGAEVSLVGLVGEDIRAEILKELLEDRRIDTSGIMADRSRETILKTRVMAHHHPHHQQVVRIDREDVHDLSARLVRRIEAYVRDNISDIDGVIIEDYGKGLITAGLLEKIITIAKKDGKMISVDPKENHFDFYKGVNVITPNRYEAEKAVGFPMETDAAVKKGGEKLLRKLRADVVLITLGEEGMMVFRRGRKPKNISTVAQDVFDVSGAGDTVIGVYTLARVSGAGPLKAAHIANCAAGIVVSRTGTAVVGKSELLKRLKYETRKVRS